MLFWSVRWSQPTTRISGRLGGCAVTASNVIERKWKTGAKQRGNARENAEKRKMQHAARFTSSGMRVQLVVFRNNETFERLNMSRAVLYAFIALGSKQ